VPNEKARVFALQITFNNIYQYKLEGFDKLITEPNHPIYIEAPWSESQTLRLNDYLVCPYAKNEVYRIAQIEFKETYKEL
jgi:intein/homing endonuclease